MPLGRAQQDSPLEQHKFWFPHGTDAEQQEIKNNMVNNTFILAYRMTIVKILK